MKFLIAMTAALLLQSGMTFRDRAGNVQISALEGRADRAQGRLNLTGKVVAIQKNEGLEIKADEVDVWVTDPSKQSQISKATAKGAVQLTKKVTGPSGSQSTVMQCGNATYTGGAKESLVLLQDKVTLRSLRSARNETMVATGQRGTARLENGVKGTGPSGLKSAELTGGVKVTISAVEANGTTSKLVATGGRLLVDETGDRATITMLENVQMEGDGAYGIRINRARRVTMQLNEKGEVVSWKSERGQ